MVPRRACAGRHAAWIAAMLVVPRVAAADADGTPTPATAASGSGLAKADASQDLVVVWPTLARGDDGAHRPPSAARDPATLTRAQELDATLRDAVQDLGFVLAVTDAGPLRDHTSDLDVLARAAADGPSGPKGAWVISPRIEPASGDAFIVRIVAVPPRGNILRTRVERVKGADVAVRGLVMLRELMSPVAAAQAAAGARERDRVDDTAGYGVVQPVRSAGRAVLATSSTIFGGFTAYSLQRASGNEDPRVLYPLLAVGAGVGLGGSLLAAEEWDLTAGDAWFLTGGTWWGVASGILLSNGYEVKPLSDRYNYGAGAGFIGLGLSTVALTRSRMDEGDAALLHSGAGLGLGLGALTEMFVEGSTTAKPALGAGYGTGIGLAGAGALASLVQVPASRVLLMDIGAGLGALAGAAAASPLVFEDVTAGKARGFLASTAGGAVAGAGIALFVTRSSTKRETIVGSSGLRVLPTLAVPGASSPALGGGFVGSF